MNDKDKIETLLRAFKMGSVDMDYATKFIKNVFSKSESFNYSNFRNGFLAGWLTMYLVFKFIMK